MTTELEQVKRIGPPIVSAVCQFCGGTGFVDSGFAYLNVSNVRPCYACRSTIPPTMNAAAEKSRQ